MNNHYKQQEMKLTGFRQYLIKEKHISEITAADYCKRVITVAREEGVSLEKLTDDIERVRFEYTEGSKAELGRRSHNSFRAAIIHYCSYVMRNGGTLNSQHDTKPSYVVDIHGIPEEGIQVIRLYDKRGDGALIDVDYSKNGETRDLAIKCLNIVFNSAFKDNPSMLWDILKGLGVSLITDGVVIF